LIRRSYNGTGSISYQIDDNQRHALAALALDINR
jgi:hypothetical protein